ncbi:MAG: hypothetical protein HY240_11345 [Actinobacteria bacterium]|nr:hypothetical protein [Actinomycetota bacterium]
MTGVRRLLVAVLVVGLAALAAGVATFAAFTSFGGNSGNTYSAGTVALTDNDAASAMWSVSGLLPGDTVTRCIRVTYSGTLPTDVRLYAGSGPDPLDQYLTFSIEKGTMPSGTGFPNCGGFSSEATIFSGTLQGFRNTDVNFASGAGAYPGSQTRWNTGDSLAYRFTLTFNSAAGQGLSSTAGFTWEARNQ